MRACCRIDLRLAPWPQRRGNILSSWMRCSVGKFRGLVTDRTKPTKLRTVFLARPCRLQEVSQPWRLLFGSTSALRAVQCLGDGGHIDSVNVSGPFSDGGGRRGEHVTGTSFNNPPPHHHHRHHPGRAHEASCVGAIRTGQGAPGCSRASSKARRRRRPSGSDKTEIHGVAHGPPTGADQTAATRLSPHAGRAGGCPTAPSAADGSARR